MRPRAVIVVSHPIQHFCPLYRFAEEQARFDLHVLFAAGLQIADADFGGYMDLGIEADLICFPHSVIAFGLADEVDARTSRKAVWARLDDLAPDGVVLYGFSRRIVRLAWSWAIVRRRRRIYISDSEDRGDKGSRVTRALRRPFEAAVLLTMGRILAVGVANEAFYRRRAVPVQRMRRVPFSIDRRWFDLSEQAGPTRSEVRDRLGLADRVVVMNCGKFIARKRQADIIDAAASSGCEDLTVLLVGSGPDEASLRDRARRLGVDVRFTGFVSPRELPSLYRAADIYVHPSSFDPHPLAVSEAIYVGLPVIVSDRTGSWGEDDDVRDRTNGFVHPAGDVERLSELLRILVSDASLRAAFAAESRRIGVEQQRRANEGFVDAVMDALV